MYMCEFVYSTTRTRPKEKEHIRDQRKDECVRAYIDRRIQEKRKETM